MARQITLSSKDTSSLIARVLAEESRELYKEVKAKTREEFGEYSLAYRAITHDMSVLRVGGSQFFWNTNLSQYLPKGQRVISLEDAEMINDQDESFFRCFYADVPEIILKTNVIAHEKNQYILADLIRQIRINGYEFSSDNPLRISGLDLVQDENPKNGYGLLLRVGGNTKIVNDGRFAYWGKQVQFGKRTKIMRSVGNGLSGVHLDGTDFLDSNLPLDAGNPDTGEVVVTSQ